MELFQQLKCYVSLQKFELMQRCVPCRHTVAVMWTVRWPVKHLIVLASNLCAHCYCFAEQLQVPSTVLKIKTIRINTQITLYLFVLAC
jgi:hypothetical protein